MSLIGRKGARGRFRRRAIATMTVAAWSALSIAAGRAPAHLDARAPSEYQAKAASLYNIARFVEWPRGTFTRQDSPFVVCVIGTDPFERSLDEAVAGKAIAGRVITVRRLAPIQAPAGCHILFVAAPEAQQPAIMDYCQAAGILTVGDGERFAERGGHVGLYMESNRVRLAVNMTSADQAGLRISSKLLSLAKIVRD